MDASNASSAFRKTGTSRAGDWTQDAWVYLRRVGELQYFVSWRSWSASRCRLVASALDEQGAPTGSIADDDPNAVKVRQIVTDIAGGASGQARIIRRAAYVLSVPGECWIGMVVRDPSREETPDGSGLPIDVTRPGFQREQWYVFGRQQINVSNSEIELKLPDGSKHIFNPDVDVLFRVWDEHPEDPSLPFSPVWSNQDVLNEIVKTTATVNNANDSRLIGNGLWMVPQEMSLPTQASPMALPIGATDTNDPAPFVEPNAAQTFQDLLFEVASAAKRDPDSMAAMLPLIASVPAEYIKDAAAGWMRPSTEVPETALKTREAAIRRLATGLDTSPERLLGMSTGNHWTSWLIEEGDIKVHISPVVELICSALTQEILRFRLAEEGLDPDAYVVWYDTTGLTQDPDKTDEAKDGFDRGAISARALREHLGFDDEDGYDLTKRDGWIELAMDKIAADPALNTPVFGPILEKLLDSMQLELGTPTPALPPGDEAAPEDEDEPPADAAPPEPATTPEPDEEDEALVSAAAMTIARLCVNRALELANKRRRTRASSADLRNVPIERAHLHMASASIDEVPSLVAGWDVGLNEADLTTLGLDPEQFRRSIVATAAVSLATCTDPILTPSMLRRF